MIAAPTALTSNEQITRFFQRRLLHMLQFWRDHEAIKAVDVTVLDAEREQIIRTVSMGLESKANLWSVACDLVINFSPYIERRGYWAEWNTVLQQALEIADRVDDIDHETILSALLARLSQRQNESKKTITYYRRVIHLARQTRNRFEKARAYSNLGYLFIDVGYWWRAEVLSRHALCIFEDLDSDHGRAHTHNHLGLLHTRKGQWAEAEHHLNNACRIWLKTNDTHSLVFAYTNLGLLYNETEQPVDAISALQQALYYTQLTGDEASMGHIWNNIGIANMLTNNLEEAELCLRRAEKIFYQYANYLGLAQVWDNLGTIFSSKQAWVSAKQSFEKSLDTFRELHNWEGEIKVQINLIDYELARGNQLEAHNRIIDLEALIISHKEIGQTNHFLDRLEKIRRSANRLLT